MLKLAPYDVRAKLISDWAKVTPTADLHAWAMAMVCPLIRYAGDTNMVFASKLRAI